MSSFAAFFMPNNSLSVDYPKIDSFENAKSETQSAGTPMSQYEGSCPKNEKTDMQLQFGSFIGMRDFS
jgi:hypothetical protein